MKLVLFDFDGVLVDTLGIAFAISLEVEPELSLAEYTSMFEGNIYQAIESGKRKHIPDFDEKYKERTRELIIPEELKKILKNLSTTHRFCIVSSTPSQAIKDIVDREGLSSYFMDILGADVHKSKVVKTKMLLEKYKVLPGDAIFVTDTVGDILEARECEVRSIGVIWGWHDKETLGRVKPEWIVDTPAELEKAILEM